MPDIITGYLKVEAVNYTHWVGEGDDDEHEHERCGDQPAQGAVHS